MMKKQQKIVSFSGIAKKLKVHNAFKKNNN